MEDFSEFCDSITNSILDCSRKGEGHLKVNMLKNSNLGRYQFHVPGLHPLVVSYPIDVVNYFLLYSSSYSNMQENQVSRILVNNLSSIVAHEGFGMIEAGILSPFGRKGAFFATNVYEKLTFIC